MACTDGKQGYRCHQALSGAKKGVAFWVTPFLWAFAENPADQLLSLCYQACSSRVTMSSCEGMRGLLLVQMSSSALAAMESRL